MNIFLYTNTGIYDFKEVGRKQW